MLERVPRFYDVFLTQYLKNSIESPGVSHLDITVVYYIHTYYTLPLTNGQNDILRLKKVEK